MKFVSKLDKNDIIRRTIEFVKDIMKNNNLSHNWEHVESVMNISKIIHDELKEGDRFIVIIAAILHDIADYKYTGSQTDSGTISSSFLLSNGVPRDDVSKIKLIIDNMEFKEELNKSDTEMPIEGKIVRDADNLDAMGMKGITKWLIYTNNNNDHMYDPTILPNTNLSMERYMNPNRKDTAINLFYEKLFKLKDFMNTEPGKRMAKDRHDILVSFVKSYENEYYIHKDMNYAQRLTKYWIDTYLGNHMIPFDRNKVKYNESIHDPAWGCSVISPGRHIYYESDGIVFRYDRKNTPRQGGYDKTTSVKLEFNEKKILELVNNQ